MVLSVASYHIRACFSTDGVCCGFGSAARYTSISQRNDVYLVVLGKMKKMFYKKETI